MEYLNDYSGLPSSLLDSALSYKSIMRSPPSCKTDRSDCTNDGCNADTSDCSVDGVNPCSRDSGCYDRPCSDCSYDGVCTTDGICDDTPRPTGTGQITLVSRTERSITIRLKKIEYATEYYVVYRLASDTTPSHIYSYSLTVTISGLTPGTEYAINYRGVNSAGNNSYMSTPLYVTTLSSVKKWNWGLSNGNASANATTTAYYAVTGKGLTSDFSYLVWNDMVDKVQEILTAKDLSWNSSFLSISATKMSSWDKTLTADRFNSLRYNIGLHYSTGINTVSKGDTVYGWYFTTLTNCMNNWIDQ